MKIVLRGLGVAVFLALVGAGWLFYRLTDVPEPATYYAFLPPRAPDPPPRGRVTATFLGVATLLISDGQTSLMTDGFFTRPPLLQVAFGKITPDREVIARSLRRAGVDKLAAVVVVHSHYDHSMDAPEVARVTGALLVGSESTAQVGRGWNLDDRQIRVVQSGERLAFGRFRVRLIESVHAPLPEFLSPDADGISTIRAPLVPPASAYAYKLGRAYSVLIEHPSGNILVQGSAGFVGGALDGVTADIVFLSVGGLGLQTPEYRQAYFKEVVTAVGASRVIPIHWDNFTLPLDEPLRPNLNLGGGFGAAMDFLIAKAAADPRVTLQFLPAWRKIVLFERAR